MLRDLNESGESPKGEYDEEGKSGESKERTFPELEDNEERRRDLDQHERGDDPRHSLRVFGVVVDKGVFVENRKLRVSDQLDEPNHSHHSCARDQLGNEDGQNSGSRLIRDHGWKKKFLSRDRLEMRNRSA